MVSPTDITELKTCFDKYSNLKAPDMYSVDPSLSEALFDLFTLDSHIAGLATRVLEGGSLSKNELSGLPDKIVSEDGSKLISISEKGKEFELSASKQVQTYAVELEKVRSKLLKCV